MKLSKWGICSRSEGTSVEPSRAGSRWKCVLSKMMVTTCVIFPRGELSWQSPAGLAGAGGARAAMGKAAGRGGGRGKGKKTRRGGGRRAGAGRGGPQRRDGERGV